jgi:STE24 endopeptidase
MRFTGSLWWLWLFGFLVVFQVLLMWLYPTLIAPLFNRFVALPEGPLRSRLEALARDAGFANRGLYLMDASRRSGHSNAYFTGLFRPRIVLFDTLVERMSVDEAASVLAHEIGHYRAHHVHRRLALSLLATFVSLLFLSWLVPWPPLHAAFGFSAPTLHGAVALLSLGGGAFVFWLQPLASRISRRHEYEADRYSIRLARAPEALKSALLRLNGENLSNLHPHPWYSAWHYSHPALVERLAAIDREGAPA